MTSLLSAVVLFSLTACTATKDSASSDSESTDSTPTDSTPTDDTAQDSTPDSTDDVLEIAIRRVNDGQDLADFQSKRDAFVARLDAQPGVQLSREFASFFDFSTFSEPSPPVFVGMTQYDDADAFAAAGAALGTSEEAGAFFATFTPELFNVVTPLVAGTPVDLAGIADGNGEVLEVAWRDLSAYPNFDASAYATTRDAALAALGAVDGVIAEYQWTNEEAHLSVGMTVYESADRFFAIASDPNVVGNPDIASFFGTYPAHGGFVNMPVN